MRAQRNTSWDELGAALFAEGIAATNFTIGEPDDPTATLVSRIVFPPGVRIAPHSHQTDYAEIILEGAQKVSGVWHKPGDVRIVRKGVAYGPLIAGSEGATVLVIFRHNDPTGIPARTGAEFVEIDRLPGDDPTVSGAPSVDAPV